MWYSKSIFTTLPFFLLIAGCSEPAYESEDTPIAQVGDEVLTLEELQNSLSSDIVDFDDISVIETQRNEWIREQVLAAEARRLGLHEEKEFQKRLDRIKNELLVKVLTDAVIKEFEEQDPVSRQDAQAYYEENKEDFTLNERHVRYRHIIADNRQNADNAVRDLRRGHDWNDVAHNYDISPYRAIGESRQYHPISEAAAEYPPINNFLNVIGITEISPIRRIGDHYHFVQLRDDRPAGDTPEPEWILDQVQEWLTIKQKRNHLSSFERNLVIQAESNNEIRLFDVDNFEPVDEFEPDTLIAN